MHDLTAAGRVTHMDGILEIEGGGQRREVIGIVIHVMAVGGLARASVTPPIVCDHSIATLQEEQHLCVPIVGRERPTMGEHHRLTTPPILEEYRDPVVGPDRVSFLHRAHPRLSGRFAELLSGFLSSVNKWDIGRKCEVCGGVKLLVNMKESGNRPL